MGRRADERPEENINTCCTAQATEKEKTGRDKTEAISVPSGLILRERTPSINTKGDSAISGCHYRSTPHLVLDVVQSELEHDFVRVFVPGHGLVVGRPHCTAFDGARKYHLYHTYKERNRTRSMQGVTQDKSQAQAHVRPWYVQVQVARKRVTTMFNRNNTIEIVHTYVA